MAILSHHVDMYREIFALPGMLEEPFLQIGYQGIAAVGDASLPDDFAYPDVKDLLQARGLRDITTIDYFDHRADLRYDLNRPVPEHEHERYQTVLDIGTIEHLFDTRQCLENCIRMVTVGGLYFLVTPVKGFFDHGFHTFDPWVMTQALEINNLEIVYQQFTKARGERIEDPKDAQNTLIWIVARKTASMSEFQIPQQEKWGSIYEAERKAAG